MDTLGQQKDAVQTNILSAYKIDMVKVLANSFLLTHPVDTDHISIYMKMYFWPPDKNKSNIPLPFISVFGLHQLPRKILACWLLNATVCSPARH